METASKIIITTIIIITATAAAAAATAAATTTTTKHEQKLMPWQVDWGLQAAQGRFPITRTVNKSVTWRRGHVATRSRGDKVTWRHGHVTTRSRGDEVTWRQVHKSLPRPESIPSLLHRQPPCPSWAGPGAAAAR